MRYFFILLILISSQLLFAQNHTIKDSNGNIYSGKIISGDIKNGTGKFKNKGLKAVYEGEFKNDKIHGKGTLVVKGLEGFKEKNYSCLWDNGTKVGKGELVFINDDGLEFVLKGVWELDNIHEGELRCEEIGSYYKGSLLNEQPHGFGFEEKKIGEYLSKNEGYFAFGQFLVMSKCQGNCKNGIGVYKFLSGNIYDGEWKEGQRTGKGKFIWAKGAIYDGDFKEGQLTGKGKLIWANGDIYDGDWKEDKRTGKGKLIWANGDIYDGDWKEDKRTGRGKLTRNSIPEIEKEILTKWNFDIDNYEEAIRPKLADHIDSISITKSSYTGNFKNGTYDGKGTLEIYDQGFYGKASGVWKGGKMNDYFEVQYRGGDRYKGMYKNGRIHGKGIYYNYVNYSKTNVIEGYFRYFQDHLVVYDSEMGAEEHDVYNRSYTKEELEAINGERLLGLNENLYKGQEKDEPTVTLNQALTFMKQRCSSIGQTLLKYKTVQFEGNTLYAFLSVGENGFVCISAVSEHKLELLSADCGRESVKVAEWNKL